MKQLFTLLILCASMTISFGQTEISIEYTTDNTVLLNGNQISSSTTYEDLVKILGEEPVIYKEYPTGKVTYHYKETGLAIHTVNGKLLKIGANFNWDGDKNFPEATFKGALKIGSTSVNNESKVEIVDEMEDLGIKCIMPGMCMNNPKVVKNPILIGFEENLITQVSIEFH